MNLSKNNKSKNLTYMSNIAATEEPILLTSNVKKAFNYLRKAFIKVLIIWHFDLKNHIEIKTNILNYAIDKILI